MSMLDAIRSQAESWGVKVAFAIIIIVFVFGFGWSAIRGKHTDVVAYVNEQPILAKDFQKTLQRTLESVRRQNANLPQEALKQMHFKEQVLGQMINGVLVRQEAARLGIAVTEAEIRKTIASNTMFQSENGQFDPDRYKRILTQLGATPGEYEQDLRLGMLADKLDSYISLPAQLTDQEAKSYFDFAREEARIDYVLFKGENYAAAAGEPSDADINTFYEQQRNSFRLPPRIRIAYLQFTPKALADPKSVTDQEIQEYYEKNKGALFSMPERVKARHLLIKVPENAPAEEDGKAKSRIEALHKQALGGADFAELAKKNSEDASSTMGGDLGWFVRGQMVPAFDEAAFSLPVGKVSEPVRTAFGWHLIKVEAHEQAHVKPLAEIKDDVRTVLAEEHATERINQLLDRAVEELAAGSELEKAAQSLSLPITESPLFSQADAPALLRLDKRSVETLFSTPAGTVIDSPLSVENGYILAKVLEQRPEEFRPLAEVKPQIRERLIRERSMNMAKQKAEEFTAKAQSGAPLPGPLTTSEPFTRRGFIPNLGAAPALVQSSFKAKAGEWLPGAYQVTGGYVAARLKERIAPSQKTWEEEKQVWLTSLEGGRRSALFRAFLTDVRNAADIRTPNPAMLED